MVVSLVEVARSAAASLDYGSLKPEQELAIPSFLEGNDVFVSLPMGYGKSLCYAALPCAFDNLQKRERRSIVVVVSPLIALMKDRVSAYSARIIGLGLLRGCGYAKLV